MMESLDNLLATLRQRAADPVRISAIPALPALHRGDVIEIQGPASSGKTHLLYHLLLAVLVPSQRSEIAVVVYDTDAAFDIQRFRHLLLSRISRLTLEPHECLRRALARLHLFRPTSFAQLAVSIANLPTYHSSHMPNQEIAVLAIDSISSFYWADRFATEQLRDTASARDKTVPMALPLHHVLDAIQTVQRSHCPLAILTNWALNSTPPGSDLPYRQHLHLFPVLQDGLSDLGAKLSSNTDHSSSSPFRLTHHISLSSPSSDPFKFPAAPLDDTLLRDARHGKEDANNGQALCLMRSCGVRNAVRFIFQITDDDTLVLSPPCPEPTP